MGGGGNEERGRWGGGGGKEGRRGGRGGERGDGDVGYFLNHGTVP